ncbi:hypothetical protein [Arthrobacter sp. H14-L1]|uniref:hypothetical protein n=1 Tax=Arthrobacter sp. H14-L1 TaxID=2996697 RepID=UPI0022712CDA|nr:hypothetical protein [Arthrobacter sp. H14-L1]MCY0906559.1 hypothetical protein [Arthrobacter sp. H14-L1]
MGLLFGGVGDQPLVAIVTGGVGIVGVKIEVPVGVAKLVFLASSVAKAPGRFPGREATTVGGEDVDLPGPTTLAVACPLGFGGDDAAELAHLVHLPGLLRRLQGKINEHVRNEPGPFFPVFINMVDLGEEV